MEDTSSGAGKSRGEPYSTQSCLNHNGRATITRIKGDAADEGVGKLEKEAEYSGEPAAAASGRVGRNPNPFSLYTTIFTHKPPLYPENLSPSPLNFAITEDAPPCFPHNQIDPQTFATSISGPSASKTSTPVPTVSTYAHLAQNHHPWIIDCGATDTMTNDLTDFICFTSPTKTHIETASGERIRVQGGGSIKLSPTLIIPHCLYVPGLSTKLLSISHITKALDCVALIHPHCCILQDIRTKAIIGRGTERGGLYYFDEVAQQGRSMLAQRTANQQLWLWHRRLGHPSFSYLKLLFPSLFTHPSASFNCETCIRAKSHRTIFRPNNTRVDKLFSLVHSDVWGPANISNLHQFQYFILFIDDFSRMTWVYFLKQKSDVPQTFIHFYNLVQTQYQTQIKILRTDNGSEYTPLRPFFQDKGLVSQTSCPHSPQQNGVAERKNRIILEMARSMLLESHTPKSFWPDAIGTAVYLLNRLPTKALNHKTPLQILTTQANIPPVLTLPPRVFGCSVYVHIPKHERSKLDSRADKCLFVGYASHQKGYRCYNPTTRRLHVTMDCQFLETEYYYDHPVRS